MVLDDVYRSPREGRKRERAKRPSWEARMAAPIDRLAAAVADVAFFAPLASLAMAPFRRDALLAQLTASRGDWAAAAVGAALALLATAIAYQALFLAWLGATPGKRLFGLRVVSIWTGEKLRPGPALARAATMALEALALGAPWLAIFSNERRRPLHDRVGDSAVVAVRGRTPAGAPTASEAGAAAGLFAAFLAIGAAIGASLSGDFATVLRESENEARELEDRGLLCAAAADLRAEWPEGKKPSRLEAALALAAAGLVDKNCLYKEADREAWLRRDRRALAYAAKAIARADEPALASAYAEKACAGSSPDGDACLIARLASPATEGDSARELAASASFPPPEADVALLNRAIQDEAPSAASESGRAVASVASAQAKQTVPIYVLAFAVRRRMDLRDYSTALDLIDRAPARRGLAPFFQARRAKALWALGRRLEARSGWTSSIASSDPEERRELRKDQCSAELELGCAADARRACADYVDDASSSADLLADAEAVVAFVRGGECAQGDSWSAKAAKAALSSDDGKAYVSAVEKARSGAVSEAKQALKDFLASAAEEGPLKLDAQARLASLASTVAEAEEIRGSWQASEFEGAAWADVGRALMRRFLELGAPKKALAAGLALRDRDPFNSELGKTVVVAAYRAGDAKIASELLKSVEESAAVSEDNDSAPEPRRSPASAGEFERVARELRRKSSDRSSAARNP